MDRIASQADKLQRSILASLPFGCRVAMFYGRLASSPSLFGQVMFAEFIRAGVSGPSFDKLPDIQIDSVRTDYRKVKSTDAEHMGKAILQRLYKLINGDHDLKEQAALDIMTDWMVRVMDPSDTAAKCRPGMQEKQAYKWLQTVLSNKALNFNRDRGRSDDASGFSKSLSDKEDGKTIDLADPSIFQDIFRAIPRSEWRRLEEELQDVLGTERNVKILDLKIQGDSNQEVAEKLGISGALVGQILKQHQQDIIKTVQRFLA